ncbi:similar to RIKEN cDNA 0610016J10 gene, isoform CRA_b [Rattus norvegicus]|uniref:Similar to RIKEN cDNA 0610016J10 n=1 Tax=Rattus norvegicus TaxID=10116 RepID=A6H9Z2_RAT|nr:similar to RIKEN cDNA 0610016J10 gene, isoform CRA_b [Rattus norvegicus]
MKIPLLFLIIFVIPKSKNFVTIKRN